MQTRYGADLVTPGEKPPKHEIKRFDEQVQNDYNKLTSRQRELSARLAAVNGEHKEIIVNLGAWVADGCDYKEYTDRLAELRAEREALEAGLEYLNGQAGLMLRLNHWLK